MNRLRRLLSLPRSRLALLARAAGALLVAAWQVRRWPFARVAAALGTATPVTGHAPDVSTSAQPSPQPSLQFSTPAPGAVDVQWAISAWSRTWPWPPTCLMQALAARKLLLERGLPCDLYFGVRSSQPQPPRASEGPAIGAHAWLCCGLHVVTGASEARQHRPIAVYRSPGTGHSAPP